MIKIEIHMFKYSFDSQQGEGRSMMRIMFKTIFQVYLVEEALLHCSVVCIRIDEIDFESNRCNAVHSI